MGYTFLFISLVCIIKKSNAQRNLNFLQACKVHTLAKPCYQIINENTIVPQPTKINNL